MASQTSGTVGRISKRCAASSGAAWKSSASFAAESAAMLVATHDFDFAARLCTRFVMLDEGRVAFDGANLAEVVRHWESHEGA
jgi:ABC-type polysaccharide/polyol phosphate transport system ATPase subunit